MCCIGLVPLNQLLLGEGDLLRQGVVQLLVVLAQGSERGTRSDEAAQFELDAL
jgi:hypothetical protein